MNSTRNAAVGGRTRAGVLVVFAVVAILIGCAGYSYFLFHKRIVVTEKYGELAAIADLKAAQIAQWRKECLSDAEVIFSNPMVAHRIVQYLNGQETEAAADEFRSWLTKLCATAGFVKATLVRPDGAVIYGIPDTPLSRQYHEQIAQAARLRQIVLSDFHREAGQDIHLDLIVPILYAQRGATRCVAVLALGINPQKFLYPLIQTWPSPTESAETTLVERDGDSVLYLNELRHRTGTALTLRRPLSEKNMPAVRAALGQEGVFEGVDYRGVPVLAATRTISGSPWAILAKIDSSEVFAPVTRRAWFVASLSCMTALVAGLLINLWWMRKKETHLQLQYQSEVQHNLELKQAEISLHQAQAELEKRVAERTIELTRANSQLRTEIAERKQLELKLIQAKQLESVGQLAGGVAHEVRNPLNAILTITEALFREEEIENRPEYTPYIEHIRTQVNRLAHLMNDLLELGKPIPGSNLQPLRLYTFCLDTVSLWLSTGMAPNRQVEVFCLPGAEQVMVMADDMRLQQVLFNLLENAGHHAPQGTLIRVQVITVAEEGSSDTMAVVRIIDAGPGIPAEKLSRIFEPFYSDRKGGTGLGLTLVRHFMEHMEGSVSIRNNSGEPGCTAEIHLPLAAGLTP